MAVKKKVPYSKITDVMILGMEYRVPQQARWMIEDHVPFFVRIEREPENEHDSNALRVHVDDDELGGFDEMHLGYIGKETAAILSPEIDSGAIALLPSRVTRMDANAGTATMDLHYRRRRKSN